MVWIGIGCTLLLTAAIWTIYILSWERGYFAGRKLEKQLWEGNCVVMGYGHWEYGEYGKHFVFGPKPKEAHP